jgi:hypothetical protein
MEELQWPACLEGNQTGVRGKRACTVEQGVDLFLQEGGAFPSMLYEGSEKCYLFDF